MIFSRLAVLMSLPLIVCIACRQSRSETAVPPTLAVEYEEPHAQLASTTHMDIPEGGVATEIELDSHNTLALQFAANAGTVTTTVYIIPPEGDPLRYSDGHK